MSYLWSMCLTKGGEKQDKININIVKKVLLSFKKGGLLWQS